MRKRRSSQRYHDASSSRSSHYRESRYLEPRYQREGCLERIKRFFTNLFIIIIITSIVVIGVGYLFTHFQQVVLFVRSIFAFITFVISIFPLLLRIGLVLLSIAMVLIVGYGLIHLISNIRERMAQASLASSKAKQAKLQAKLQKDQGKLEVQRKQVVLAQENHAYDQRVRRDYAGDSSGQQLTVRRATRNLALEEQTAQRQQNERQLGQPQSSTPPSPPSISQLLGKSVRSGQTDMLHGFEITNGRLEEVRGELPITAIVAGRGGSGKTRRIILMVFQAILAFHAAGGGKITICDPHWIKPDGLANVLAPFADWLHFARTDEEIIAAAKEHVAEMESRLTPQGSLHGEGLQPRLIIIDEFGRLMKSENISTKDKHILTKCVRETAVQWRGVKGRAWIGGQEFTQDAIGDTAIRKDAQAIFCHQLSDEYASFLFPRDTKAQRLVQQIGRRESVYKDEDNGVRRIATITVDDPEIDTMVAYLTRCVPRQVTQRRQAQQIPKRPRTQTQSEQRAVAQQQGAAFYLARTEELAPKQPSTVSRQRIATAAPATWGSEYDETQRHQYGYPSSRTLQNPHVVVPVTPTAHSQAIAMHENEDQALRNVHSAPDDTWLDTVLVPEEVLEASLRTSRQSQTAVPSWHGPSTESLTQRPTMQPVQNSLDALAAARDKKKKR